MGFSEKKNKRLSSFLRSCEQRTAVKLLKTSALVIWCVVVLHFFVWHCQFRWECVLNWHFPTFKWSSFYGFSKTLIYTCFLHYLVHRNIASGSLIQLNTLKCADAEQRHTRNASCFVNRIQVTSYRIGRNVYKLKRKYLSQLYWIKGKMCEFWSEGLLKRSKRIIGVWI